MSLRGGGCLLQTILLPVEAGGSRRWLQPTLTHTSVGWTALQHRQPHTRAPYGRQVLLLCPLQLTNPRLAAHQVRLEPDALRGLARG
jgi:hypothetical protein